MTEEDKVIYRDRAMDRVEGVVLYSDHATGDTGDNTADISIHNWA